MKYLVKRKALVNTLVDSNNQHHHKIFKSFTGVAEAIAKTFGNYCEVVIHDLRKPEASIIYIVGNVTNRKIGAPITNFVLENLIQHGNNCPDSIAYKSFTRSGNTLKSSTVYIRDLNDEIIGAMCINYDITELVSHLDQIVSFNNSESADENNEFFATDVTDILDTLINQVVTTNGVPIESMKREDKIKIVSKLDIKGVFLIKGAIDKVASILGVSRYTVYNYLEQDRANRNVNF